MSLSRNCPGNAESTGTGPANRVTTPGVVNKKLNVPQNSTIAIALPIADRHNDAAAAAVDALRALGLRAEIDDRTESVGRKIRDAELRKIAAEEGWEVVALDRLGRRLKVLAALGTAALVGGVGSAARGRVGARSRARA